MRSRLSRAGASSRSRPDGYPRPRGRPARISPVHDPRGAARTQRRRPDLVCRPGPKPAVPRRVRPVRDPRLRGHGPADTGRQGRPGMDALHGAIPDRRSPCRGRARRRHPCVAGTRVQPPGAQPVAGRGPDRGAVRRSRPARRGRPRVAPRGRAVHGACGRGARIRHARRGRGYERAPGPWPDRRR